MKVWIFFTLSLCTGVVAAVFLLLVTVINSPYGVSSLQYSGIALTEEATEDKRELARASLVVPEDYLGIIFVPFTQTRPYSQIPVVLKIYDKSTNKKIHEHTYVAKNFSDKPYFPVGLPIISHSRGRTLVLSVVTQSKGERTQSLASLNFDFNTKASTVHLVDRRDLRKGNFAPFLLSKTLTSLVLIGWGPFVGILILCIVFPFLIFTVSRLGLFGIKVISMKPVWMFMLVLMTMVLVFEPYTLTDGLALVWIIGYLIYTISSKASTRSHYAWALGFLLLCPLLLIFREEARAEKCAIFVFFFLCFGVGHEIISMIRHRERYNEVHDSP